MKRPFCLSVDSASREEPPNRYFGTLEAAQEALEAYPERFRRFAWIIEFPIAGPNIIHVKDGVRLLTGRHPRTKDGTVALHD